MQRAARHQGEHSPAPNSADAFVEFATQPSAISTYLRTSADSTKAYAHAAGSHLSGRSNIPLSCGPRATCRFAPHTTSPLRYCSRRFSFSSLLVCKQYFLGPERCPPSAAENIRCARSTFSARVVSAERGLLDATIGRMIFVFDGRKARRAAAQPSASRRGTQRAARCEAGLRSPADFTFLASSGTFPSPGVPLQG